MKDPSKKFSCVIIGSGTLPIRCAELWLLSGHEISAIVSRDAEARDWSVGKKIRLLSSGADLVAKAEQPFDFLFSIVNETILDESILNLPGKLAINYHDGPLPRYAGTHATSWALTNCEREHGITWHVISDLVDGGDILKQKQFGIAPEDTAYELNTRCYQAACEAFSELIADISFDRLERKRQDLDRRTFFPRFKRPPNGGVISWDASSESISALVRALDFGPHPNPLGTAKLAVDGAFLAVSEVESTRLRSVSPPGTINEVGSELIRVSTADHEVVLRRLRSIDGRELSVSDLASKFGCHPGQRLASLPAQTASRIEELVKSTSRHESFWVNRLSDLEPAALPLAGEFSVSPRFDSILLSIPQGFKAFVGSARDALNLEDCLIAAFVGFISRITGNLRFDISCSGPDLRSEVAGLEGLFAAQVPVRFDVRGQGTFADLIEMCRRQIDDVVSNKTFALDVRLRYPQLAATLSPDQYISLPVSIVLSTDSVERVRDVGHELTFVISEGGDKCEWLYDGSRFEAADIERLGKNFETLLANIGAEPNQPVANVSLLTEDERQRVLIDWNSDTLECPSDSCVHHLFEAQVKRTPDEVALIHDSTRFTYAELNRRANQIARRLQTLGVGPEVLVAVCLERSVELVETILGILKAGGAYVPLDPAYPRERLLHILRDSRSPILVAREMQALDLNQYEGLIVDLDMDRDLIRGLDAADPVSSVGAANLAYVIYTSGSTGNPKGVAIEHRNTVAFLAWATSVFNPEQLKRTLASTSVCFDLSVFEIFAPLICGGAVVLVENILHLPAAPAAHEVTLVNTVPSAIAELVRGNGIPESVRTVNLAGEPLKTSLVQEIYETGTVREVFDLYGPSEDTTYSTFTLRDVGRATIGRPISNTQAYVVDSNLQPVPIGIAGELYLAGAGVARGYLNQPELTEERFIRNPFSADSSARMYKTGDLVRYLPSGAIEYLGRIDNQVKIRGFRIELGEVESVLLSHSAVAATVVTAKEEVSGQKYLAAYYACHPDSSVTATDLRGHLKQRLPDYMVPSAFVELDRLPLTPNGKVDRKALPEPAATLSEARADYVAQRDEIESQLVRIWEDILDIYPIGVTDDFFELGGHSLKAIRMFAEIEETFGKNIPLATLFESGTVEKLAAILRQDNWSAPESSLVPIQPRGEKPPFFCIHAKGGNVLFYRDLAKYLGNDQPFYGLQARRLAGRQIGHPSVEEMAEFYIREIRGMQPAGPYYVGGSSFGGLVAFEIAQQLRRRGERVALLALLDTGTPDYPRMLPTTTAFRSRVFQLLRRVQHHKDSLIAFSAKERSRYVLDRLAKVRLKYRRRIRDTYKKAVRKFYSVTSGVNSIPKSYIQIEDLIWKAGQRYTPEIYEGDVTLFRASIQPLGIYPDPTLGWRQFVAGELQIHEVPGHHGSIVAEPYVRVLAEALGKSLDCAQLREAHSNNDSEEIEEFFLETRQAVVAATATHQ